MSLPSKRRPRKRNTNVPGAFLGYSLQVTRLVHHLVAAKTGDLVCLEVLGDTAVISADGEIITEESKSRTTGGNPIADRSLDLWKTIRNWVDAVAEGKIDPWHAIFRVYLSRPFGGNIAWKFHNCNTLADAIDAVEQARSELLGGDKQALPSDLAKHVEIVFRTDPTTLAQIIRQFEIDTGSGGSVEDVKTAITEKWISPDTVDDVLRQMVGWVKNRIDSLLEGGRPAIIGADEFVREAVAFARKLDQTLILTSLARHPSDTEKAAHIRSRLYIRQLELIELEDDDKLQAVSDYIMAESDRIAWAERGLIHASSFDEFETDLVSVWRNHRLRSRIRDKDHTDVERGVLVYADCCDHSATLAGVAPPSHFCRGSFHAVADRLTIGWHPDYKSLLKKQV